MGLLSFLSTRSFSIVFKSAGNCFITLVLVNDHIATVAAVDGQSMQPLLNPQSNDSKGRRYAKKDFVLINKWAVRDYQIDRGDLVALR